jgi:hypothetical protein
MSATVTRIHSELPCPPGRPAPASPRLAELDIEAASQFLVELDGATQDASAGRLAYLLGVAEGHLANMIELARAGVAR